jgi:hypothetical protein
MAVVIEITRHDRGWESSHRVIDRGLEIAVPGSKKNGNRVGAAVDYGSVREPVAIEIAACNRYRPRTHWVQGERAEQRVALRGNESGQRNNGKEDLR